ncbi:MAG: hypothetical protein M1827_000842 [Pycnora praestabilis]|nr:MAG: hypothetical protein M1827_000842 [Pycnora praestabilis]
MQSSACPRSPLRFNVTPRMHRKRKYSARAFYISILVISAIAVLSLIADSAAQYRSGPDYTSLRTRGVFAPAELQRPGLRKRDGECRHVHKAPDKCAFVRANCPDEEAGLLSYLSLYYCRLHHVRPLAFVILVLWLGLLFSTIGIAASDFFCINLSTIAAILGMSESMAGVTFLAFGNGSPDVFSTFAAMKTHSGSLAVGELIGAAGFITAVVGGSMALVRPFKVARRSFVRDVGFFIFAASFSMVFLADGSLHLWECAVMVGFYIFYVLVVVVWHWWLGRRRRRREREAASRSHFYVPGAEELEVAEEYRDDDDGGASERRSLLHGNSEDDFRALENAGSPRIEIMDEDEEDEARERWLAELSSNMRISRPARGERRNTVRPIRPSLVGALEFRAVLSSLQKSRNIRTLPINLRRYSDDPNYTTAQQHDQISSVSEPEAGSIYNEGVREGVLEGSVGTSRRSVSLDPKTVAHRARAVSTNDATGFSVNRSTKTKDSVPTIDLLGSSPPRDFHSMLSGSQGRFTDQKSQSSSALPGSPSFSLSPPASDQGSRSTSPAPPCIRGPSPDLLAPPQEGFPGFARRHSPTLDLSYGRNDAGKDSLKSRSLKLPRISIPRDAPTASGASSPTSSFPMYTDSPSSYEHSSRPPSTRLLPPSISPESMYHSGICEDDEQKPLRWWPYKVLPPPRVLASTLFPTLYSWHSKNLWEKFLGIVAAPSVFLLAITLPVVEADKGEDDDVEAPDVGPNPGEGTQLPSGGRRPTLLPSDSPNIEGLRFDRMEFQPPKSNSSAHGMHGMGATENGFGGHGTSATVAAATEQYHHHSHPLPSPLHQDRPVPNAMPNISQPPSSPKEWNRWLVAVQTFTAPFFIVLIVWANGPAESGGARALLLPTLYSLLASCIVLGLLIFTTIPSKPPWWRFMLCFVGFVVAIAWISTIANEVVGVLKAFGVILGISDAILGLTIFAVGNSLGDLVADITVARLGYPVMALSACFGGPMLNILLGIGLSGLYMTVSDGEHRHEKHPHRPMKYKPYQIEVSSTLMVSAVTLLVTLVGLLIVVPWNGWRMDRRIGWGLIGLWIVSTIGNLVVEITGFGGDIF